MDKTELAKRIREIEGLTNEERSELLALLNSRKRYGLIWEDKPEEAEEILKTHIPVLTEVKDKEIAHGTETQKNPNHILIEGDNLHALTSLCYTHEGKIDVIYIDPPYNTGNKDFVYNDSYVDSEDSYRHSKWLSFMNKRLRIAKRLLSDKGVIFISIDDNEQANLKLLCDEVFGENNNVGILPTIMNLKGNQDQFGFAGTHEYTFVYAKNKYFCSLGLLDIDDEELEEWFEDEKGFYKKGATLKRTGQDAPREKRPYGYFPILINKKTNSISYINENEFNSIYNPLEKTFNDIYVNELCKKYSSLGYLVLLPSIDSKPTSWRWSYSKIRKENSEIIIIGENKNISLYKKQRPEIGDLPSKKPKSVLYKASYSSGNGTSQLKQLSLDNLFSNPKPIELIIDLLKIGGNSFSYILDFFAGSGTTLHATMQLNAEDGGHRQCILVTNNENDICEKVTYERNKRVINGYTTPKGVAVEGLKANNLRYFRCEMKPRELTHQSKRELVMAMTDILRIKEDIYTEQNQFGSLPLHGKTRLLRYFADGDRRMLIVYDTRVLPFVIKEIGQMEGSIKIYLFADGAYPYTEDFRSVMDKVELVALPHAFSQALKHVLPQAPEKALEAPDLTEEEQAAMMEEAIEAENNEEQE